MTPSVLYIINKAMRRLNTQDFIKKAKEIHGELYDYSMTEYKNTHTLLTIICNIHGEFQQAPSNHLRGTGCLKCSQENKQMTTETFIERARAIHGSKFDYSNTKLTGMNNKVVIICPDHGSFEQRAASHLGGIGCSKCSGNCPHTTESFIENAQLQHNFKYEYSDLEFNGMKHKVTINCLEHGTFSQMPSDHLAGCGCPDCGGTKKVTTEEFIKRANNKHNNEYSYEKTEIVGMNNKVTITCKIHGDFEQRPADHVNGVGCPECSLKLRGRYSDEYFHTYQSQRTKPGILYLVTINDAYCKVGITTQISVSDRFRSSKVKIINEVNMNLYQAYIKEQAILNIFSQYQFRVPELKTIKFAGWTECFPISLLPELIQEFNNDM